MKQASVKQSKSQMDTNAMKSCSIVPKGVAVKPPDYGIGFLDAGMGPVIQPKLAVSQTCTTGFDKTIQRQSLEAGEPLQDKPGHVTWSGAPVYLKLDPTISIEGVQINDDPSLEHEADVMGAKAVQFVSLSKDRKLVQEKFGGQVAQKAKIKTNNTGLPDNLKAGIENLSGMCMDDVKVHYNSEKPVSLNALAYTQGKDIHVRSGQEKHLPHEAWHVVQQNTLKTSSIVQKKLATTLNKFRDETNTIAWGHHTTNWKTITSGLKNYEELTVEQQNGSEKAKDILKDVLHGGIDWLHDKNANWPAHKIKRDAVVERFIYDEVVPEIDLITNPALKSGVMTRVLGGGQVGEVGMGSIGGESKVLKAKSGHLNPLDAPAAFDSGVPGDNSLLENRAVASYRIAELLGQANMIVNTGFAEFSFNNKKKRGLAMEVASGRSPKKAVKVHASDAYDPISFYDPRIDIYDPNLHKNLSSLQVMDVITGQVDRHAGNYFVNSETGDVKGIDNDFSFGKQLTSINQGIIGHYQGLPAKFDPVLVEQLTNIPPLWVRATLNELLPEQEVNAAVQRYEAVFNKLWELKASNPLNDIVGDPQAPVTDTKKGSGYVAELINSYEAARKEWKIIPPDEQDVNKDDEHYFVCFKRLLLMYHSSPGLDRMNTYMEEKDKDIYEKINDYKKIDSDMLIYFLGCLADDHKYILQAGARLEEKFKNCSWDMSQYPGWFTKTSPEKIKDELIKGGMPDFKELIKGGMPNFKDNVNSETDYPNNRSAPSTSTM